MHTVKVIAHRGFSTEAPENTLAAFRRALELKIDMIECDVRLSKDGRLMVIHDETVDRTTNGTGAVSQMTFDQLRGLDAGSWFGPEFACEKIPTLDEALDAVKNEAALMVEIKEAGQEDHAVTIIRGRGMSAETVITSFHDSVGFRLPELDETITFSLLYASDTKLGENESVHLAGDAAAVNATILAVNYRAITAATVKAAHAGNMQILAWTVDDPEEMGRMAEMGVDIITSNKPDILIHVLQELGLR
ncbi:MAG TPA: glycerophosphodiester phosphodiesterase family protein [Armatimonadota bacterium]